MATIGSATLTAPLICSHGVATSASVALPVYDDEVGLGGLPDREPDDRPERELCPGDSARLSHLDRLATGRLQKVAASCPVPASASGSSSTGRPRPAYCTDPAGRECRDLGSDLHSEGPALPHGSVGGVGKSEWYPYACYYCECRFKFVSARSMHIVDVHTNLIISSGPNEAERENRPGDAFGGEDSDRSPGINFDTPKEILAHQKASHPWPEPPAEELSPSRAGGHGASQSEWEPQFPQVPASGVEKGSGSTFCLPRVQMDTPSSPKREIEAIYVNEESPFLQECELPDGPGSARDPLSFEDESEAFADDMHSTSNLQSIKKEVHEDLLPVSGCNGFIKEEPDLYVGVDSSENEEASTREDASDITRTGQADPDLPHPGDSRSVVDIPASDTMTSTGDAATLVSESGGTTTGGGSTTDATFGIVAGAVDEEQCSGDAGTRPPFSYAELIAMAIVQSPHRRAMLSEIYSYVASRFPYYAARKKFLQKMISNNVARYSCFVKLPQEGGKLKRHYWMLDPQYEHTFENGKFRPRRRMKQPLHSGPVSEGHTNGVHSHNGEHRLDGRNPHRRQHRTGMSEHLQLLEFATESLLGHSALQAAAGSGRVTGDSLSPPAYPHYPSTATPPEVGNGDQAAPDSSHPGSGRSEDDTLASDKTVSTGDTTILASTSGVTVNGSGGGTGIDSVGTAAGSAGREVGEEQRLSDTGSAVTASTKPPFSYTELIAMAIEHSPHRRALLPQIHTYITRHFPYYGPDQKGWQIAIKNRLSSSKCFVKVPQEVDRRKGNYWMVDPQYEDLLKKGTFRLHRSVGVVTTPDVTHGPDSTYQSYFARCRQHHNASPSVRPQPVDVADGSPSEPSALRAAVDSGDGSIGDEGEGVGGGSLLPSTYTSFPGRDYGTATPTSTSLSCSKIGSTGRAAPDSSHPGDGHREDGIPVSDGTTSPDDAAVLTSTSRGTDDVAGEERCSSVAGSARTAKKRPLFSYTELSAMAIAQSPNRRARVSEIYAYIVKRFPYFKRKKKIRQKALSNNLSRNRCFINVPQKDSAGKGNYWMLDPKYEEKLENGEFRPRDMKQLLHRGLGVLAPGRRVHSDRGPRQRHHTGLTEDARLPETGGGAAVTLPSDLPYTRNSNAATTSTDVSACEVGGTGQSAPSSSHPIASHCANDIPVTDTTQTVVDVGTPTSASDFTADSNGAGGGGARGAGEERLLGDTDTARTADDRPPYSYKVLIAMAIAQSPHRRSTVSEIYAYISNRYPYFRRKKRICQNSIRCILSSYKCFVKVPPESGDSNGAYRNYWMLDPQHGDMLENRKCRSRGVKRPFHRGSAASVSLRHSQLRHHSHRPHQPQHHTGESERPQLLETGGRTVPLPTYPHYTRCTQISDENDSASFEESNLQNVTHNELVMPQKVSTHFGSYCVPAQGITTQEDNFLCSTDNTDPLADNQLIICDPRSIKKEVFEECVPEFSDCNEEDPDVYLGVDSTEIEEADTRGHTSDMTRNSKATTASTSLSVSDVGCTGRATPGLSHPGSSHWENTTPASDVTASRRDASIPTSASDVTADSSSSGANTGSRGATAGSASVGAGEWQLFGDGASDRSAGTKPPPFFYTRLIAMAIRQSPHRKVTLSEIYAYVSSHFPYLEQEKESWQKSIRVSLSFSKYFVKVPREDGDRQGGSCDYWTLDPQYEDILENDKFHYCHEKWPFCRGPTAVETEGKGGTVVGGTPLLSAHPQHTSTAATTSPGGGHCEDDIVVSDTMTLSGDAATLTSPSNDSGISCIDSTSNGTGGATVGSSGNGTEELQLSGDSSSATTSDRKPPFSYEELTAMAIVKSPQRRATVAEIVTYIASRFPFFKRSEKSWQSSIQCKLYFSKYFLKVPLESRNCKGKRFNYWMLDPQYGNTFDDSNFFRQQCVEQPFFRSRGSEAGDVAVGSGATSSPAYPQLTSAATATSASPLASEIDSTDRAAPDSSHPGGTFCEDDVPVSDVKTSTDGAATLISPCGGTGNDRRGSSVGSSANGAGDTGSASTAVGKPPFQYEELIAMAIMKSPHRRATLSEINAYIASCFPYFDRNKKSWQSSIHCKLCFSKYFIKVPLESRTYKGKRFNYWMLDPQYEDMFEHGNFCQRQHAKQPSSSRSRGSEGVDVSIGGGGVSSSGDPHCASYEHSTATTTSATVVISDIYGTVRSAADSSRPGGGHPEDDIPVLDTVTSTGGAAVLTSATADTGNSRIDDTGDNGDADGVEGEQPSGDTGSAGTADRKPPFRYEELIAMAILKSSRRRATLKEINTYIASRFPYFKRSEKSWQSSVQCKLYFSKYFLKVPLAVRNRRGKRCNLWMLDPQYEDMFERGNFRQQRRLKRPSYRSRCNGGGDTDVGGGAVSSSAFLHCVRSIPISDRNDSASFEESNLQNVTHDELATEQGTSAHFNSNSVPTRGIISREDNHFRSTDNTGSFSDDPLPICDLQTIKKEVAEDVLAVLSFSGCVKEEPELDIGVEATENEEADTRGHFPDITWYTTPTSTSLSASVVGSIVQSAPDFPHSGGDLCEPDTAAPDVVTSAIGVGTSTPAPDVTADRSGDGGTGTDSERIATSSGADGAGEGQLLGDGGSASTADTRLPFSYRTLISMAIVQSPLRKVTRSEIYAYIVGRFPYLKRKGKIVQHSLSCTLSSSKCFVKVPREADDDKRIYWTLDPRYNNTSDNANFRCLQQMEWPFRQGLAAAVPAHRVLQAADAITVSGSGALPPPVYPPYTSVSSAGQAAPDSSQPGDGHCENDTLVSDTTSAGDAAFLTSDSGGTADRGETAAGHAADGIGEEQCRSTTGSASTAKKKPLFSYTELSAMAIAQSPHRRAKLYEIFAYVTRRFPYFRRNRKIWQKALSTTLSRNKCFINVRQEAGKLKGSYWMFDPQYEDMLKNGKFSLWRRKRPFRSGATAAVPAREARTRRGRHRHRGLHPQWQQHVTGLSEQPQLPETGGSGGGGGSLLLPAYPPRTSTTTQMSADLVASEVGSGDPAETDSTPTSADRRGDGTGTAGGGTALDGGVIGAGEGQCSGSASSARTARKRPQFSYTELSAMAIAQSPHRRAKLSEMYAYIMSRFPYYRRKKFWQKAFSNNLSRSKCFVNVPLEGDKQKGNYWMLDPKYEAVLEKGNFHHRHEELPFLGSPAVSVPLRRQRHGTGLSEHPQVPESGGCGVGDAAAPLPSYQHYSRPAQICDGSDSASFEESNLQNVTRDELLMAQEMSTHFISCSDPTRDSASFEGSSFQNVTHNELVTAREMSTHFISCSTPTRGIITREDNSFCSTDNIDGPSDDSHPICDLQNVKVEVVEDPLTVPWFNGCFKEDPDTYLGVNATESEEEARGRHTPDVTRESTDALTSTGLSVAEVGSTGRTAPVSPHLGGSHSHSHRHGHDATPWMSNPGTPTFATCDTTNDSGDRTDVDSREIGTGCVAGGAAEKRRLGNTGSASAANTKPQFSYKSVIASAIAQSPHRRLTLSEIYAYIASHFPYLRGKKKRMWKNSVRCCLWYHKCFVKVPQEGGGDKAKCCNYWTLDPRYEEVSENGKFRHRSEKWLFRRSPAASPSVRRVHAHHSRHRYPGDRPQRQPLSGPSAHSQLPETATSAATATWSGLLVSDADSTVRAAPDPPHPGSSHLEGTVPASDATVPTDCAATQNSPSGGTGNGRDRRASTVGGPASGAGQKRSSDDTGSASIARSKPPFQYEELIAMAILKSPHRRATLSEIKAYIASRFPYFERSEKRWQKSVHCKLFFSDFFVKVPLAVRYRRGKQCNLWMLDPRYENMFRNGNLQRFRLVKQPSSRSRGIRGKGGRVGVRAVPSCAPPHSARYEHSTDPATHHSSRSRDGCCQDDSPTSDAAATPGDAAASTSASSGSDIDTVGTATGKAADGAGEERHPSVAGLAGTAEKKPPFSYTELSAMAIADSPHRRAKLSEIFAYVTSRFPYYELGKVVWQRALSVNLSRSKCFVNVWHGSSTYWMLNRRYEDIMEMGRLRRQHVKRAFFGGPTAAVGARRVPTRHSLRKRRNWRRHTGLSEEQSRLPESGAGGSGAGAAVSGTEPPPASPHCTRSTRLSDGNDSASFEESNLQNVTHDESIMAQERLTHFASCRVMTQGITTEEDNSFCSTNNSEALAGGPLTVSDPQSIKKEVFEDPLAVSTFSRCIKEDPDLHFEVDATDNEEEATRGHASDVTCAATLTSTGLSVNDIGGNGPAAPDTSLCSNAHGKDDVALRDVTVLTDGAGTPTFTFSGTATSSDGGTDTCVGRSAGRSAAGGAHEERRLRDASSVGPADSKLQFSYKDTIAAAIAQSPHRRLTVPEIYAYITSHFPNFRGKKKIWRNSVRWCLWYHKCFVKVPLEGGDDKARCCNYWTLDPQYTEVSENVNFRHQREEWPFRRSPAASVTAHRDRTHRSLHQHLQRRHTGLSEHPQLPNTATGTATPSVSLPVSDIGGTCEAASNSSRPGDGRCEDDTPASDVTASPGGTTTPTPVSGGDGGGYGDGTDSTGRGTAVGSAAGGAREDRHSGDAGSAWAARKRPPHSYTELSAMAIAHSPNRRAKLSEIHTYIMNHFPYFTRRKKIWQKALSTILSHKKCFVNVPQKGGNYWMLDPQYEEMLEKGKFRRRGKKRPFRKGPGVSVAAHRVPTRHSQRLHGSRQPHRQELRPGLAGHPQLPDTAVGSLVGLSELRAAADTPAAGGKGGDGGGAVVGSAIPLPAYLHCDRYQNESTQISDGNDSTSLEESNLQNGTRDEIVMEQETSTHFISCSVLTQDVISQEDNSFCSSENVQTDAFADDPLTICDTRSIKREVFEDPLEVTGFGGCIKEDPDLRFGEDATDNRETATRGHASDITRTAGSTPTGPAKSEVGGTGRAAADSSHLGGSHCEHDTAASDVTVSTGDAGTLTSTSCGISDSGRTGTGRAAREKHHLRVTDSGSPATTKPQLTHKALIASAIAQSPYRKLTLSEIYDNIASRFPYFRRNRKIWLHAISCCLWYNKCFVKVPQEGGDDKAKCCNYWTLDPQYEDVFENGNFQRQQHTKRPFSWSRGVRSRAGVRGVHAVPSSAYLQSTRHERSTGRATRDPSRPGTGSREDDVLISDTTASAVGVPTLAVTFGGTADSVARGTVADSGTAAGDGAAGAAGDTGSPCTADVKPPFSYTELNAMAIMHSPHRRATLSEIYTYVTSRFPYCKRNKKFWQRALSNNLCRNECFVYAPQEGAEQKGSCWKLDPQYEDAFENGKFRHWQQRHRAGLSVQSGAIGSGVVGIGSGAVPHPGDMQCASSPAEDDRGTDRRSGHPERDGPDARDDDSSRRTAAAKWEVSGGNDGGAVRPALDCEEAFARGQNPERRGHGGCGHTSVSRSACHRVFERRGISNRHVRLHAGERPYDCHVCHKTFVRSSNLREHLLLHTGQRPYRCSFCLKAFTASSKLRKHLRVHANCATSAVRGSGGDTSEVRVECQDRDVSSP